MIKKTHYKDPITETVHGNSRKGGDASDDIKQLVIDSITDQAMDANLSYQDIANLLAIAQLESGFNPSAANDGSTASGVFEIVDRTADYMKYLSNNNDGRLDGYQVDGSYSRFDYTSNISYGIAVYLYEKSLSGGSTDIGGIYRLYNPRATQKELGILQATAKTYLKELSPQQSNNPAHCFPAGTLILLPDGTSKPIEAIAVGDRVASFDPEAGQGRGALFAAPVTRTFNNTHDTLVRINGELLCTPTHRVLTGNGTFQLAGDLQPHRDSLVRAEGAVVPVESVVFEDAPGTSTYNFEVGGSHTYVASGIRVHNDSILDTLPPGAQLDGVSTDNGVIDRAFYTMPDGTQVQSWENLDANGHRTSLVSVVTNTDGSQTTSFQTFDAAGNTAQSGTLTPTVDITGATIPNTYTVTLAATPGSGGPLELTATANPDGSFGANAVTSLNGAAFETGFQAQMLAGVRPPRSRSRNRSRRHCDDNCVSPYKHGIVWVAPGNRPCHWLSAMVG